MLSQAAVLARTSARASGAAAAVSGQVFLLYSKFNYFILLDSTCEKGVEPKSNVDQVKPPPMSKSVLPLYSSRDSVCSSSLL